MSTGKDTSFLPTHGNEFSDARPRLRVASSSPHARAADDDEETMTVQKQAKLIVKLEELVNKLEQLLQQMPGEQAQSLDLVFDGDADPFADAAPEPEPEFHKSNE